MVTPPDETVSLLKRLMKEKLVRPPARTTSFRRLVQGRAHREAAVATDQRGAAADKTEGRSA